MPDSQTNDLSHTLKFRSLPGVLNQFSWGLSLVKHISQFKIFLKMAEIWKDFGGFYRLN